MSLDLGRVVAVHPEDHSVDLVMVRDNARLVGVQVLASAASSDAGRAALIKPAVANTADKWDRVNPTTRDVVAIVGYVEARLPVVVGFMFPQVSALLFPREDFSIERHPSHWYQSIDAAGNVEWFHPSGTFVRVAEDPEHEDLTGNDFDGKFATSKNTTRQPWLSVMLRAGGAEVMRLRVDPSGNVILQNVGDLNVQTAGNVAVAAGGDMTLSAAALTINAPVSVVGASVTHNGANIGESHTHTGVHGETSTPH